MELLKIVKNSLNRVVFSGLSLFDGANLLKLKRLSPIFMTIPSHAIPFSTIYLLILDSLINNANIGTTKIVV